MKNSFWYHKRDLKVAGPYSFAEARNLILRGKIRSQDQLFNDTAGIWKQAQHWADFEQSFFPPNENEIALSNAATLEQKYDNYQDYILLNPSAEERAPEPEPEPEFVQRQRARRMKQISSAQPTAVIVNAFWYFRKENKMQGPFSYKEICECIEKGLVGPRDLLYNDALGSWKTTQSYKAFSQDLFPISNVFFHCKEILDDEKEWVVLTETGEDKRPTPEGPFSNTEIFEKIRNRKFNLDQYIWRPGMMEWCRIKDVPAF